ncbi:hypothetical protein RFI_18880 [Reticulomyxa filosa]|uniref:Uncharacterized protein n=1 Tax=Reticulomyxa filosa TaxID=46433 RepID=X6MZB7_RETFI|nr:hypothetical protein RFI_18880 [Reticulomyxa filosa]|eukprot:ETO18385.1 hypothetical protein RFI_18880 [Reticulomyxa filosa]
MTSLKDTDQKAQTRNDFNIENLKNAKFEEYYTKQKIITDKDEWDLFLNYLRRELPTTFRINAVSPLKDIIRQKLKDDVFNLKKSVYYYLKKRNIFLKPPFFLKKKKKDSKQQK